MAILKRDGSVQDFDIKKIELAVMKAMIASGSSEIEASDEAFAIGVEIEAVASGEEMISVAEIHTLVENALMDHCQNDAARAYIEYRKTRDNNREAGGKLLADINGFLDQSCDEFTKENANKPTKLVHTHRDLLAGILSKHLAVTQILPKHIAKAHADGFIHVHDCDYLVSRPLTNCCLVNYPDMLQRGFRIGNASISSPKSIGVACTVISQIALSVSSCQYGGQTYSHLDRYLKPYVEMSYEKNLSFCKEYNIPNPEDVAMQMTDKDVFDGMQSLLYQINTLTSTNG